MMALPAWKAPPDDVGRAWHACWLFLASFVAAFVVGEGISAALGYVDHGEVSMRAGLLAGIPACVVFALPTLLVAHYGRRAVREGHPQGQVPVWVALGVSLAFLVQNLAALAAGLLTA